MTILSSLGAVLLIAFVVYFIPTAIALARHKRNKAAIFALNVFLGWTFVGWVVALVWSLTRDSLLVSLREEAVQPPRR